MSFNPDDCLDCLDGKRHRYDPDHDPLRLDHEDRQRRYWPIPNGGEWRAPGVTLTPENTNRRHHAEEKG